MCTEYTEFARCSIDGCAGMKDICNYGDTCKDVKAGKDCEEGLLLVRIEINDHVLCEPCSRKRAERIRQARETGIPPYYGTTGE